MPHSLTQDLDRLIMTHGYDTSRRVTTVAARTAEAIVLRLHDELDDLQQRWEKSQDELATVTAERDEARRELEKLRAVDTFDIDKRFAVVEGSESGHCCFEATVVDKSRPLSHDPNQFETVCECFSLADAEKVCQAMNFAGAPQ